MIGFGRAALHLGGLWALAFAQPLFDLLGRNAEFFVARASTTGDILLFAFGYALVPPLLGAAVVWGLGRIRPDLGWWAMLVLVALIVAALLLPPAGDLLGGSWLAIPVALLLGAGAAALYARAAGVRSFVTVLSPAPLVVLILFLVASPVRGLLFPSDAGGAPSGGPARSGTPIVHVVFDELPLSTLTRPDGTLDAALFPNFARLARTATWYRNATTVDDLTTEAVPAQLTGRRPQAGRLPTTRDHPQSLFTLFERSHALTVIEPITDLCPERLCEDVRPETLDRLRSLESDVEVVVKHLLYPEDLRDGLPAIDTVWEGFDTAPAAGGELRGGANLRRDVLDRLAADDATAGFERAIAALDERGARPPLLFVHSTLPHGPWRYLPDGREYPIEGYGYPGLADQGWVGPQWQVDQGFQRHVLQVQYVDRLLGELLDALDSAGVFEDAVVVVTADHGASFVTGRSRRPAHHDNVGAIAPVPFLVKAPGQRTGRVDDAAVRTVDVLPTIAAAAGVDVPWRTDGVPAAERDVDSDAPIAVSHAGEPALTEPLGSVQAKRRARDADEQRLLRGGVWAIGPRPDLLGRRVPMRPVAPARPAFFTADAGGLPAGTELALAVDGRIAATTRVYREGDRLRYTALLPLRDDAEPVRVFQVVGNELRPLD